MSNIITKTLSANGSVTIATNSPKNVVIEGTFGAGTVTESISGTSTGTASTADAAYYSTILNSTFTLTGATTPTITITVEEVVQGVQQR